MDFDPRWSDDRDDARRAESGRELNQGSRGGTSDALERESRDPRDVFTCDLDLPRGPNRKRVWMREQSVLLRGSEARALATVGAFRVAHAADLRNGQGQPLDPRDGDLRHLKQEHLVRTIPVRDGRALVVLTERGRDVIERNRHGREQQFYAGLQRPRELLHDARSPDEIARWAVDHDLPEKRAVSMILRQPGSAVYGSDSTVRMSAGD